MTDTGNTTRPDPSGREYIEITDFSPGIFGDMHAATSTRGTSDPTLKGMFPVNGAARIDGTNRCHADKSGSLVPLPKAQLDGTLDGVGPTWNLQPNRTFRYVLDAQLGTSLVDTSLERLTPMTERRRPLHIMWGFWADDSNDYHPVVLGREYRPWLDHPYDTESLFDFLLGDAVGETVDGVPVYPLPIGSLARSRFYIGNTEYVTEADDNHINLPGTVGNGVFSLDAAALDIVGDLTVTARVAMDDWTPAADSTFVSKWLDNVQRSWQFQLQTNGTLRFLWTTDGSTIQTASSTVAITTVVADGETIHVAVTFDVDNGAAGKSVRFWTSTDGSIWTQLGATVTTAGVTSIFSSTAVLCVGGVTLFGAGLVAGNIYDVSVRTGIGGGGIVGGTEVWGIGSENYPPNEPTEFVARTGQTVTVWRSGTPATSLVVGYDPNSFNPSLMYPVTVCLAATPWPRWGKGNVMRNGNIGAFNRVALGVAPVYTNVFNAYHPAIGLNGIGTCQIAMSWHNPDVGALPQASNPTHWFYHYSEKDNVFANEAIEGGPINPYLLMSHQGRVVMADRRRTRRSMTVQQEGDAGLYGTSDDLLWYSDYALPCQNPRIEPLNQDGTPPVTSTTYDVFPKATMSPYNKLIVAEDDVSEIGTIGVTTVDQMLVVKHQQGGAMISGDLDSPTIRRLPYIESTGGAVCKGAHSPIGFVYGSVNGIFVWQGGDTTTKLSQQINGFFWDHTNGTTEETYAGSRGRMAYWNGMICVPNNFVYDIDAQSWWRLGVTDLQPIASDTAPYNCYDRDEAGVLYAFPYRNKWPDAVSHVTWPATSTNVNALTIPDAANFSAPTALDIRVAIGGVSSGSTDREIIGHYDTSGNQRAWSLSLDSTDHPVLRLSTNGSADSFTITSTAVLTSTNDIILLRVTWDSVTGAVEFYTKFSGVTGLPQGSIAGALRGNDNDWVALHSGVGAIAALFNSTSVLRVGNRGAALSAGFVGDFYGAEVRTVFNNNDTTAPVVAILPGDIPSNLAATSFTCTTGQTVTVTRAGSGNTLTLVYEDPPLPVWHTFDQTVLDNEYEWSGHPLVETRGRVMSFQEIQLVATGKADAGHASTPATIEVTLSGFKENGSAVTPVTTTFTLANTAEPQILREDVLNFTAQYVSVKIHAEEPITTLPAPKIHQLRIGVRDRARSQRTG